MTTHLHHVLPAFAAFALIGCGSTVKGEAAGVPFDAAPETSVSGLDAAPGTDAGSPVDATPDADANVPTGPGVLLFAGYGEAPLSDTWNWDGSSWTQLDGAGPSVRSDQSMIGSGGSAILLF